MDATRQLGPYQILRRLAVGGMAEIHLALRTGPGGFQQTVVVKTLLPHLAADERYRNMFLDEARLAARLQHPNIVQIQDFGTAGETHYIVMEHVVGVTLRELIDRLAEMGEALGPELTAWIAAQAADALDYAHGRTDQDGKNLNVVHRDVSPDNIMLTERGFVKLLDFGIAKAADRIAQTETGVIRGKVRYMSPEQLRGDVIDHRADLYQLVCVIIEMLRGQRFAEQESDVHVARRVLQGEVANLVKTLPDVDARLRAILGEGVAPNLEDRFDSGRELQNELERYIEAKGHLIGSQQLAGLLRRVFGEAHFRELEKLAQTGVHVVAVPARPRWLRVIPAVAAGTVFLTLAAWLGLQVLSARYGGDGGTVATLNSAAETAPASASASAPAPASSSGPVPTASLGERTVRSERAEGESKGSEGLLSLTSNVPLHVRAADRDLGDTPLVRAALAPGRQVLQLANADLGIQREIVLYIPRRGHLDHTLALRQGVLAVDADPWANVELGGKRIGTTPLLRHVLWEGRYELRLVNPDLGAAKVLPVHIKPGETTRVRVQLP